MRDVGRLRLLFLFVCILPALSFASDFSDCYPSGKLDQFWGSQNWLLSNAYIGKLGFANFYSPLFDDSLQQLSIQNATLMNGEEFSRRLPAGSDEKFTTVRARLDTANTDLGKAKEQHANVHQMFFLAKTAFDDLTGPQKFVRFLTRNQGNFISGSIWPWVLFWTRTRIIIPN